MKIRIVCIVLLVFLVNAVAGEAAASQDSLGELVLEEINLARAEPSLYAEYIREWRQHFRGKFYQLPGTSVLRKTREGIIALNEAIDFLARQKPLPPLRWSSERAAAAAQLNQEQRKSRVAGQQGGQSGGTAEKSRPYGAVGGGMGKNIAYVPNEPRMLVMQLIVDDGVPDRSHRNNLFNPRFKEAGVACGPHERFGTICVADFSGSEEEKQQDKANNRQAKN